MEISKLKSGAIPRKATLMTIETRIKKLEGIMPTDNNPFDELSNVDLDALENKLKWSLYKAMKDKQEASEFKKLFIDEPDIPGLNPSSLMSKEEVFSLLERKKQWELEHERREEIRDEIIDYYENVRDIYKFYRGI